MPRCAGFKPSGEQCERIVRAPQTYCFAHDPSRSQERTRNASKAGKSRPSSEIRSVKNQLQDLTNRLLSGEVERADAAVCGQLLNVKLRALEQERRWLGDRRAGGAPTAGCSEIDPSPYRCVRCLLEDLCTTMVDTIERSTPKSKADRSNIIETRYRGCRGRPE